MRLTKQRKVYGAVLGLALLALGVDRFIFSPGDPESPAAPPAAGNTPHAVKKFVASGDTAQAQEARLTGLAALAKRMRDMAEVERLDVGDTKDAFVPAAAWVGQMKTETASAAQIAAQPLDPAAAFREHHHLVAVLKSSHGGVAILDGKTVRIGQHVDAFSLVTVGDRTALFRAGNIDLTLELPADSQLEKDSITSVR